MVAQCREEAVFRGARAVAAGVGEDVIVVELADVGVNRRRLAGRIVVVTLGDDKIGVPTRNQGRDSRLSLTSAAVITNGRKAQRARQSRGQWGGLGTTRQRAARQLRCLRALDQRRQPTHRQRQADDEQHEQNERASPLPMTGHSGHEQSPFAADCNTRESAASIAALSHPQSRNSRNTGCR